MLKLDIKQGKGGDWRWHLYEDGAHSGMSSIQGYATKAEAHAYAKHHFGSGIEIVEEGATPDESITLFAGPRDWMN